MAKACTINVYDQPI